MTNGRRRRSGEAGTPRRGGPGYAIVDAEISRAFPNRVDTTITDQEWVPAHADVNWTNLTSPEC